MSETNGETRDLDALDLTILVGTMTGTAQLVAQELELTLDDEDTRVQTRLMDGLDAGVFDGGGLFLICTSTYGQGDVPDNAKALYESLQTARPDLSRVRYGVIALGDRTYAETFCNGGKRFDAILAELGAMRIGEPCCTTPARARCPRKSRWNGRVPGSSVAGKPSRSLREAPGTTIADNRPGRKDGPVIRTGSNGHPARQPQGAADSGESYAVPQFR